MPKVQPDYTECDSPPTDGVYPVQVKGSESKTNKEGIPYLKWTVQIIGDKFAGRSLNLNTPIGGPHAWILSQFLSACDVTYKGGEFDTNDFVGKKLEVNIKNTEYQGKPSLFPRVTVVGPYADKEDAELPEDFGEDDISL